MRRELERLEIPGEHEARERSQRVVLAAYIDVGPHEARRRFGRRAVLLVAVLALLFGLLSPPGRAVLGEIREAVGVAKPEATLFSLPSGGQLLVSTPTSSWVVDPDGSKRRLGDYREATWSPFGRYIAVAAANELAALTPGGELRWSLARPNVHSLAWSGSRTDTRIAFVTDSRLHVVGGDGHGDVDAGGMRSPRNVAPSWRPRHPFQLSYVDVAGHVSTFAVTGPGSSWRSAAIPDARKLAWSPDGRELAVVGKNRLLLLAGNSGRLRQRHIAGLRDAAYSNDGRLALLRANGGRTELIVAGTLRFSTLGSLGSLTWSTDGSWILLTLPQADQWVFVRARGPQAIRAVANVGQQFRSRSFPTINAWCCGP